MVAKSSSRASSSIIAFSGKLSGPWCTWGKCRMGLCWQGAANGDGGRWGGVAGCCRGCGTCGGARVCERALSRCHAVHNLSDVPQRPRGPCGERDGCRMPRTRGGAELSGGRRVLRHSNGTPARRTQLKLHTRAHTRAQWLRINCHMRRSWRAVARCGVGAPTTGAPRRWCVAFASSVGTPPAQPARHPTMRTRTHARTHTDDSRAGHVAADGEQRGCA